MKLLKLFLKVSYENVLFSVRGFYEKNGVVVKHLETVGTFFLDGYHASFDSKNVETLKNELELIDDTYKGFSFEGASMGFALKDFFTFNNFGQVKEFINISPSQVYINYVGVGWALARLPLNIEKQINKFDPLLRWLIVDGYGFHQAYFHTKKYVYDMIPPKELKNPFTIHVFYQGVGRALWFIESTDILRIYNRVSKFPKKYHADLWAGIGLASGYAGGGNEADYKLLKEFSGINLGHLRQGICFGVSARVKAKNVIESTHLVAEIICEQNVQELFEISENAKNKIPNELESEQKYMFWKNEIRENILKSFNYEKAI